MKTFFKNKSYMRVFGVLLIMVVFMFVTNYYLFKNSIEWISGQVKENNRLIVSSIIQSFDDSFKDLNNLIYSINVLPYEATDNKSDSLYNNFAMYKDIGKLVSSSSSNDYIEEVVVFFDESKNVITQSGTIDFHEFFNTQYTNNQYNSIFWASYFEESDSLKVFPATEYMEWINGHISQKKNLMVVAGNTQLSSKNIMVLVNVDKLLDSVNQKTMMDETSFIVLDHGNNVILSTEESINLIDVVSDFYVDEGQETILNKQEHEYIIYKSEYNGFTYINRIPHQFSTIESITNLHYIILFISLLLAILISAVLSYFLFRPNIKLAGIIGTDSNWKQIHKAIHHLQQEKSVYEEKSNFLESELRRDIFLHAIDKSKHKKEFQLQIREYFNDFFPDRQFMLVKLTIANPYKNDAVTLPVEDYKEIINRELKKSLTHVSVFHSKHMDFFALIGIHDIEERDHVKKSIQELINKTSNELKQVFQNKGLTATISKVYDSKVEHLRLSYEDILHTSLYRNIDVENAMYDFESIQFTADAYFPTEKIDKLSNLLVSGDEQEAISIIDEIIDKNVELKTQRYQFVSIVQSTLLHMKRHINLTQEEQQELYALEQEFYNYCNDFIHLEGVRQSLMTIAQFISQKAKQTDVSKLNPTFIAQYIELHYMENLYLEHMANITDTSSKYFSKYFKKTFGVNFVEYLNRVRVNYAKEYLKNEDSSVAEIGAKVGYVNATTFASTFKKYTGLSPTKYRNSISNVE